MDNAKLCVMCPARARMSCSRCKAGIYCSKSCQKADWPIHKLLCASRRHFETPPSETARRAIVFMVDEPTVKFEWVDVPLNTTSYSSTPYEDPSLDEYFGSGDHGRPLQHWDNIIRSRRLKAPIDIRHREAALIDGSLPNKAVAAITPFIAGDGEAWCGPLVALKHAPMFGGKPTYAHMEMRDLRDVADFLLIYGGVGEVASTGAQRAFVESVLQRERSVGES